MIAYVNVSAYSPYPAKYKSGVLPEPGMAAPKVEVSEDPQYKSINVSGVFGGQRPGYFEAILFTDQLEAREALSSVNPILERAYIRRTLQCRLIIDPVTAKSILGWLENSIKQYEQVWGKIASPEDRLIKP